MIFITGASRSGTTLLSHVLRNHRLVYATPELHYFGDLWRPLDSWVSLDEHAAVTAVAAIFARHESGIFHARLSAGHLQRARLLVRSLPKTERTPPGLFAAAVVHLAAEAGKTIPCEQTPRNIFYAETLLRAYPNARVVHMVRDPRGVMASQKKRWQRRRLATDRTALPAYAALRSWVNYHPYTMAKLWLRASNEARRLASHPRFTLVRFEDLLAAPDMTIRSLCRDLAIEFEPRMLEISQINSSHQSSVGGARKGFYKDAVDSWKGILRGAEIAIAERSCRSAMEFFDYAPRDERHLRTGEELRYALTYPLHLLGVMTVNPRRAWIQFRAAFRPAKPGTVLRPTA